MAKHSKVKPYEYPSLDAYEAPEEIALKKLAELRQIEGGVINNITSIDALAKIFEDYLKAKIHE